MAKKKLYPWAEGLKLKWKVCEDGGFLGFETIRCPIDITTRYSFAEISWDPSEDLYYPCYAIQLSEECSYIGYKYPWAAEAWIIRKIERDVRKLQKILDYIERK